MVSFTCSVSRRFKEFEKSEKIKIKQRRSNGKKSENKHIKKEEKKKERRKKHERKVMEEKIIGICRRMEQEEQEQEE